MPSGDPPASPARNTSFVRALPRDGNGSVDLSIIERGGAGK